MVYIFLGSTGTISRFYSTGYAHSAHPHSFYQVRIFYASYGKSIEFFKSFTSSQVSNPTGAMCDQELQKTFHWQKNLSIGSFKCMIRTQVIISFVKIRNISSLLNEARINFTWHVWKYEKLLTWFFLWCFLVQTSSVLLRIKLVKEMLILYLCTIFVFYFTEHIFYICM